MTEVATLVAILIEIELQNKKGKIEINNNY